jgi:hypothetical protein
MIAEDPCKLRAWGKVRNGAGNTRGVHFACVDSVADIHQSPGERFCHVFGRPVSRYQKATVTVVDYRFKLRQMHRDDRPSDR